MARHRLLPVALPALALGVLATGCIWLPSSASASGGAASPCPNGRACTDGSDRAGVCDGFECVVHCALGAAGCCLGNNDCADAARGANQAVCLKHTGTCVLACNANADCANLTPVAGDCHETGCVCDSGTCHAPPCSSDKDCTGGQRCVAGACAAGLEATSCQVLPGPVTVTPGARRPLTALAAATLGPGLPSTPFYWTSTVPAVATVDPASGELLGGAQPGSTTITATTGTAACTTVVRNLGARPAGLLQVVALDPVTHAGLPGVTVVVRQAGAELASGVTDDTGLADLPGIPTGPLDVDVLPLAGGDPAAPDGRTWITLAGVQARDLLVPLAANPVADEAGGIRGTVSIGTFQSLSTDSAHMAFVGFSWPGALDALDLRRLAGPFVPASFTIAGTDLNATFYSGLELGVGDRLLTGGYAPVGVPGRRVLFALVGNTPLDQWIQNMSPFMVADPNTTVPAGAFAAGLLPSFNRWGYHGFARPATTVTPLPLAAGAADLAHFPEVPITPGPHLAHAVTLDLPALPAGATGGPVSGMLALAGVFVDGEGFTPLGMDLGVDVLGRTGQGSDGTVAGVGGLPDGVMSLRYAPPSAGLEAESPWLLLIAGSTESLAGGDPAADASRSTRLVPLAGLSVGATVDASAAMLPVPTGATWDPATRTATATFPAGVTFHRWTFEDAGGHRWVILAPGDAASVTLPDEAGRCAAPACVNPAAAPARAFAGALVLGDGLTYDDLVRLDGTDLDRLPRLAVETSRAAVSLP